MKDNFTEKQIASLVRIFGSMDAYRLARPERETYDTANGWATRRRG